MHKFYLLNKNKLLSFADLPIEKCRKLCYTIDTRKEGTVQWQSKTIQLKMTPMHRLEKPADFTHSLTRGLKPHEQLERQAEFHSSEKT